MPRRLTRAALIACTALQFASIAAITTVAGANPARPSGAGTAFTTAAGTRLWYEVRGSATGHPMVMVNGGPGFDHTYVLCSDAWDKLALRRRVIIYDQRGTGRSGALKQNQSCTLADQIADLDALREQLHAPQIDLVGHSWGGYLVMAYAARHPERVAHLIIADSASPKWSETDFIFKYIFPESIERQASLGFFDGIGDTTAFGASLKEYLGTLMLSEAKRDEFTSRASTYQLSRSVNETLDAELNRLDMWPALDALRMPTLVATGRYDINVAPSTAWKIHKAIRGSRWVVFENSGHLPYFEEPEKFVQVVNDFLGAP
jgi:proline iminopeptidase